MLLKFNVKQSFTCVWESDLSLRGIFIFDVHLLNSFAQHMLHLSPVLDSSYYVCEVIALCRSTFLSLLSLTFRSLVWEMGKNRSELLGMFLKTHTTRDSNNLLFAAPPLGNAWLW